MYFLQAVIPYLSNQIYVNNDDRFIRFCKISIDTLECVRPNQMPLTNERILKRNYEKVKVEEQLFKKRKQKNLVSFL